MKNELLAPNGKPSNLNAEQYKLVRTPAFKNWFGDWEKDPANASKVVDDNGEPLVVYHSSNNDFNTFKKDTIGSNFEYSFGFHFSDDVEDSKEYGEKTKSVFLNLRNPKIFIVSDNINGSVFIDNNRYDAIHDIVNSRKDKLKEIDGIIAYSNQNGYVVMYSNQIKNADGTNTTFDAGNDDIRFDNGGEIDWTSTKSINIKINNDLYKVQYQRGERGDTDKNVWFANVISKNNEEIEGRLCFENFMSAFIYGFSLKEVESAIWNSYIENQLYLFIEDEYGNEKEIIHIEFSEKSKFENGGRTISQTPAPKKDEVEGSDINKKSSSKDLSSAKLIKFDDKTVDTIKNKVKEHNAEHPDKKINLSSAKAVVRRGMGAYSKSHRPTISDGKPNSRVAWGLARLNAFTYKIVNSKSKSGKYSQDDDLINELGFKVANYNNGGEMSKDIRCVNCGWEWNKKDSELWDMYVCHKCGFDNTTFYTSIPINNYSRGGQTERTKPDYLEIFLGK
jgi:hypothetical protein